MKDYFICFDYWNSKGVNKYFYGIVSMDLKKDMLIECVKQIIKDNHPDFVVDDFETKVTALNNIEI